MEHFAVRAVYKKGVFKPKAKLNLPEDLEVEIWVKTSERKNSPKSSLFGAFPELAAVSDADIKSAKKLWNKSLAKQSRIVKQAK
jgi:predicted DNA-binding antitoxin AbrB/MazE fold protein